MTTAELLSDLIVRGVEFQANGDKLRFRPLDRLTEADVNNIRRHKATHCSPCCGPKGSSIVIRLPIRGR